MIKKRFLLILLIVITSLLLCKKEVKESFINAAGLGKLKVISEFENWKKHGVEKYYHLTGELAGEIQYVNGLKQGQANFHYKNGNIFISTFYVDNLIIGEERMYYINGQVKSIDPHNIEGKRNGIFKAFYESGKIKVKAPYIQGKRQGTEIVYFESGSVKKTREYKNGKCLNISEYDENGELIEEILFKDGKTTIIRYKNNGKKNSN